MAATKRAARKLTKTTTSAKAVNVAKAVKTKVWKLRLYVAGQSSKSLRAIANLERLCSEHLKGQYLIEVVDLLENPHMARGDQIVAVPTLVIKLPDAVQKIIGDLSNTDRVLIGLALQPVQA
jgi:circadian clock protein KaiB